MEETVKEQTLEEKLQDRMTRWTDIIKNLSEKLKNIGDLQNLLNVIYIKRQECVEEIQSLRFTTTRLYRLVQQNHAKKYQEYKLNSQLRYTSEAAINTQIEADLNDMYEKLDFMRAHTETMEETLKTIDDIIFGLGKRVELYKILNGVKF